MSLFLPLTSADQYHSKPMAISSITSPAGGAKHSTPSRVERRLDFESSSRNSCPSPSSSSTHSDAISPPPTSSSKSASSSPPSSSRSFSNYSASSSASSFSSSPTHCNTIKNHHSGGGSVPLPPPSSTTTTAIAYYNPYHHHQETTSNRVMTSMEMDSDNATSSAPLSLHERRLRNKTASAKYRAKKNQQHGEMRAMISSLTKENELLLRQLDHIQLENGHLKATCDRLRGKIMAQKMLKQYLVETEKQQQQQQHLHHPISSIVVEGGGGGGGGGGSGGGGGGSTGGTLIDDDRFMHCYTPSALGTQQKKPLEQPVKEKGDWIRD